MPAKCFVAGVDIGSVASKAIILCQNSLEIVSRAILPTGWNPRQAGEDVLHAACQKVDILPDSLGKITVTGYGRVNVPFAGQQATEIRCHAKGAKHLFPRIELVLDIGGQDCKAILLDSQQSTGTVKEFIMNDKCAAGTGRFVQMAAALLGTDLDNFDSIAESGVPVNLSNTCTVFAESEMVGLLAKGVEPRHLAAGVFLSIARRIKGLSGRLGQSCQGECAFTGGLAQMKTLTKILAAELNLTICTSTESQFTGAIGAALLSASSLKKKE